MASPLGFSVETVLSMNSNVCGVARPLFGKDAHAGVAHHDRLADADLVHRHAARRAARAVDHDAAVHLLVVDRDPLARQPDLGPLVGGAVESFGKGPVDVGRRPAGNRAASVGTAP